MSEGMEERLTVSFEPPYVRGTGPFECEAIVVTDPETGIEERWEVAEFARSADPQLLREKGREWFMEEHGDE